MRTVTASLMFVVLMSFTTIPHFMHDVEAATVGAHVTKINTDYTDSGEAAVAFEICAGNNHLTFPQVTIYSDKESKTITLNRDVEPNTCHGGTTILEANDLSGITAFLATDVPDISIDDPARHLESARYAFHGMSNDGQVLVEVVSTTPISDKIMNITIRFMDEIGNPIPHVNYSIVAMQDGTEILNENELHTHSGKSLISTTSKLNSDSPVDIDITLNGIGLPGENVDWTGPKGEVIAFKVVPEFGVMTIMMLAVAIISIIAFTSKTKRLSLQKL